MQVLQLQATRFVPDCVINEIYITPANLAAILQSTTASTICHLFYLVDDSRSKTVKGQKQVQKMVQITQVFLNHKYEQKVKNLTGNDDFQAQEMKGKTRISSTLIRSDKTGELMIDGKVLKAEAAKIIAYFHDGKEITEAEAIAADLWTPAYYNPTPKTTMGRGTVSEEDDFGIINTYLSRIMFIKLAGQWYGITEN